MVDKRFSVYFSHSWRPTDVDLNLYLWKVLAPVCELLADRHVDSGALPPYYVNRIEEYIRRSDLFFAVLTCRAEEAQPPLCSKASLFEVRLAERARKPRFVLYERGTTFMPPAGGSEFVRYEVFDRAVLLDSGRSGVDEAIADWLQAVQRSLRPRVLRPTEASLALLPESAATVLPTLKQALAEGGYTRADSLAPATTDFEVMNKLSGTGLLVADVGDAASAEVLAMAHALFVPTIRIAHLADDGSRPELPWFLRGHPAMGYDTDVVYYSRAEELAEPVRARASAMIDTRVSMTEAEGQRFFEQRRVRRHQVFISHALKGAARALVDELLAGLKALGIQAWEYADSGRSGDGWKAELEAQIAKATHAVILVDIAFNASDICCDEVDGLCAPGRQVALLPFTVDRSGARAVRIRDKQHQQLPLDASEAAAAVLQRLREELRA